MGDRLTCARSLPFTLSPRHPLTPSQVDLVGVEPTAPTLQGSVASNGMQAHICQEVRVGNRTRSSSLPRRCAAETRTDHRLIPDGIEPGHRSAEGRIGPPGCHPGVFAIGPWDHVSDRGRSRTCKITRLSTSPLCLFAYPVIKWRVRGSHPASEAYETSLSTGPPAARSSCRPRYRAGRTGLMKASWAPAKPAFQVTKGRVELPRPCRARRSERRVSADSTTSSVQ